jgi:cell division topological specificity factor
MWNELKNILQGRRSSREVAKGRLHLVLAHDRVGIEGGKLQEMRREIAEVISKYVPIDADGVEIQIESRSRAAQLTISTAVPARNA